MVDWFFFCMIWAPCWWHASVRIGNNSATSNNMNIMLGATMGFYKQPISISVIKCVEQLLDNARHIGTCVIIQRYDAYLVGGLEHFLFFHILRRIIPTDFHIFQRGWNLQPAKRDLIQMDDQPTIGLTWVSQAYPGCSVQLHFSVFIPWREKIGNQWTQICPQDHRKP